MSRDDDEYLLCQPINSQTLRPVNVINTEIIRGGRQVSFEMYTFDGTEPAVHKEDGYWERKGKERKKERRNFMHFHSVVNFELCNILTYWYILTTSSTVTELHIYW